METKTHKVHFTLGENFGRVVVGIAREHLTINLDPNRALSTIMDSLIGCPRDIALGILSGELIITTDTDKVSVNVSKYTPDMKDLYPPFYIEEWAGQQILNMREDATDWSKALNQLREAIIDADGEFNIMVSYDKLLRFFYDGDSENLIDPFMDGSEDNILANIKTTIKGVRKFSELAFRKMAVIEWLGKAYPGEIPDGFVMPHQVRDLNTQLSILLFNDKAVKAEIARRKYRDNLLDSFLQSEREIGETIKRGIQPVEITDNYDAGWLSPSGVFYGLNGEYANMLHIQIADALIQARVIPSEADCNADVWLEENGWVKIHGNIIHYDGYSQKPKVRITEKQREELVRYGNVCHRGFLKFGYRFNLISMPMFSSIEPLMLEKLFEL